MRAHQSWSGNGDERYELNSHSSSQNQVMCAEKSGPFMGARICNRLNDTFAVTPMAAKEQPFESPSALDSLLHAWILTTTATLSTSIAQLLNGAKQSLILHSVVQETSKLLQSLVQSLDKETAYQGVQSWPRVFKRMVESILSSGCKLAALSADYDSQTCSVGFW